MTTNSRLFSRYLKPDASDRFRTRIFFFFSPPFALWAQCGRRSPYRPRRGQYGLFLPPPFALWAQCGRRSPYRPQGAIRAQASAMRALPSGSGTRIRLRACLRQGRAVLRQEQDPNHSGAQRETVAFNDADAIFPVFGRNFCVRFVNRRIKNKCPWHDKCYRSPAHGMNRTAEAGDFARISPKRSIPFRHILLQDRAFVRRCSIRHKRLQS